jgi:DNA helicase-2/ATP-dependent DNA helicase PcrA
VYETALADAGVAYVLRGGERFFDRREIREARLLLRGAARADPSGETLPDAVRSVLTSLNWHPEHPPPGGSARERWESLHALVALADDLLAVSPQAHLGELVAELDARANAQHAPTVQGVTLASLHSAKGLEWDVVFLVGLTDTTVPIQHATTAAQLAEERRLLYVGITRARRHLFLSWAATRDDGPRRRLAPSPFLNEIKPPASTVPRAATPVRPGGAGASSPLLVALKEWRRDEAKERSLPAYVIFHDRTLVDIAGRRPTTIPELLQVSGVGPAKVANYGEAVLAIVKAHQAGA